MSAGITRSENAVQARTELLLVELRKTARRQSWQSRWLGPLLRVYRWYLVGYGSFVILPHLFVPVTGDASARYPLFSIMVYSGLLWAWLGDWLIGENRARQKRLVGTLSEDCRAVGAIAQLCHSAQFLSGAEITVPTLLKLLPRVKASDARYFSDDQMQALLGLLAVRNPYRVNLRRFADLPLAVLKALEQIGDRRAIEPVRRLTTGKRNRRYHQAAQECLASLQQQGVERDYNRSLLLPASMEADKETLLRAGLPQVKTQPELLLRPATGKERG